jgi:DNA polymerase-4
MLFNIRERAIIHLNVADFAVAVERAVDSRLRTRPVIIAVRRAPRATVYDMSDEAYHSGVYKKMPLKKARRCCPEAIVLPAHHDRYERAMAALLKHARIYSPLIEMTDHKGHLFIDATGTSRLFGPPPDIAWRIRKRVRSDLGVDPVWSVASNKLVAKVASRLVKPTGEYVVGAGDEALFLAPLPLYFIPGIEAPDLTRFQELNLTRAGQVMELSLPQLDVVCGKRSLSLYHAVRGVDSSPVTPVGQKPPAITTDWDFGHDTNDRAVLESVLYRLIEKTGAELRRRQMAAKRIGVMVDYADGARIIRQASALPATANDLYLFTAAQTALKRAWIRRVRIRHLRLTAGRLTYPPAQLALFAPYDARQEKTDRMLSVIDKIRNRFGPHAIRMGRTLAASPT